MRKLDARSEEAIMVWYAAKSKGYELWDQELDKFFISRDVNFYEVGDSTVSNRDQNDEINPNKVEIVSGNPSTATKSEPNADINDD